MTKQLLILPGDGIGRVAKLSGLLTNFASHYMRRLDRRNILIYLYI